MVPFDGYRAKALDGADVWLGAGTVLESRTSVRGSRANAASVLNGEHAGKIVEHATLSGRMQTLWPCDALAEAMLTGLLDDADYRTGEIMRRASYLRGLLHAREYWEVHLAELSGRAAYRLGSAPHISSRLEQRRKAVAEWTAWFDEPATGQIHRIEPGSGELLDR
ncbi:MAG: hypothetical protein WKG00_27925 [Polyangiaceae bacterium]